MFPTSKASFFRVGYRKPSNGSGNNPVCLREPLIVQTYRGQENIRVDFASLCGAINNGTTTSEKYSI